MTSALHSSHVCLGGWDGGADALGRADLGSVDAPWARLVRNQKERTCLFRNVCFDGAREGWVYFARGNEFQHAKRVRAAVDVWARGDFAQMGEISEDHSFALTHAALPASAEWLPTPTVVKLAALAPSNFGHFLGNALYPAFAAAWRLFGERAKELPLQLLIVGPNQTDPRAMYSRCLQWAQHQRQQESNEGQTRTATASSSHIRSRRHRKMQRGAGRQLAASATAAVSATAPAAPSSHPSPTAALATPTPPMAPHSLIGASLSSSPSDPPSDPTAGGRSVASRAAARCASQAQLVAKFARELLPGLSATASPRTLSWNP